MNKTIDARGQNCPIPVVLAKKEMDGGATALTVEVDNHTAAENLQRLADSQGFRSLVESMDGGYRVTLTKADIGAPDTERELRAQPQTGDWTVLVGSDTLGSGDPELGRSLLRMYLYTLAQGNELPAALLFMNAGVLLPTLDEQAIEHLRTLANKGVEILVCGTCLNFYKLTEKLQVGSVSNMYDIAGKMHRAAKVITL